MVCPKCNTESGPSLFCYVCDAYLPSMSAGVKASIPARLGAFLLDALVFLSVLTVSGAIAYAAGARVGGAPVNHDLRTLLIVFCAGTVGYLLLVLWFLARGQTPGKWLADIRAADKRDGSEPGLGRMLLRETFGKWLSGCFFGLGWFWAIWDRDAQAWHDRIAGTVVLYRRSETSKYLAVLLVFGAPLLSVLFVWASSLTRTKTQTEGRVAALARVPFVGCPSDGQSGPVSAPKGADRMMPISASAAPKLAYYQAGLGVLAPRDWYCFETYFSGGLNLFVAPQPIDGDDLLSETWAGFSGPVVQISEIDGATSGRYDAARVVARVFPAQNSFVQSVIEEGTEAASSFPSGPWPGDRLTYRNDRVLEYQTPAHSNGLGTYGYGRSLEPNSDPIRGAAILQLTKVRTLPGSSESEEQFAPNVLILKVRVPPAMADLTADIIRQFESDNGGGAGEKAAR